MTLPNNLEILTKDQMEQIHDAAMTVLEKTGIIFDDTEILATFKKHGARIEGKVAYLPRKLVTKSIALSPKSFRWTGRDEAYSVEFGGDSQLVGSVIGAVNVQQGKGRRLGTSADMVNITKLIQSSPVHNIASVNCIEASDLDIARRPLHMSFNTLRNTTKPIMGYTLSSSVQQTIDCLGLFELACGSFDKINVGHVMSAGSHLVYDHIILGIVKEFVKRRQAVIITSCALTGVSCPIDLLGASVIQLAEPLALIAFIQLYRPGTPVAINLSTAVTNMSRLTPACGSPESVLLSLPNIQMYLDYYHIPVRLNAGANSAKKPDYQAAMETMQGLMTSILAGVNMVYMASGGLENFQTFSFEKFMMDEEMLSRIFCLRRGIEFTEEALSVEAMHEVGHGGSYLTHKSTLQRFRNRWRPTVSNWNMSAKLSEDIMVNAKELMKKRLAAAPESLLDPALEKELKRYIELKVPHL